MEPETDKYGKTAEQQFAEAVQNLWDAYFEDIEEEHGSIEKTPNGIIFQYPTGHRFFLKVIDLTIEDPQ